MRVTRTQLAVTFAAAALVHIAAAAAFFWVPPPPGARAVGFGGVAVSLGPSGGAPGNAATSRRPGVPDVEPADAPTVETVDAPARAVSAPPETFPEANRAGATRLVTPEVAHAPRTPQQRTIEATEMPAKELAQEVPTEIARRVDPDVAIPVETATAPPVETVPPEVAARARPAPPPPRPRRRRKAREPKRIEVPPKQSAAPTKTASAMTPTRESAAPGPPSTSGTQGKGGSKQGNASGSASAGSGGGLPAGSSAYMSSLLAWLQKHTEYPREARRWRLEGTALLYFEMDRRGRVQASRLQRSSGHASLDAEVRALIRRAAPLPVPPPEIQGERIKLVVPIQFFLR